MGRRKKSEIGSTTETQKVEEKLVTMANATQDDAFLPEDDSQLVELIQVERMSGKLKSELREITNPSREEIKILVKLFYQMQDNRKSLRNQLRSVEDATTVKEGASNVKVLDFLMKNHAIMETSIKTVLQIVSESTEVGQWLMKIMGIGPILSSGLLAYFDIERCQYPSQFYSYAGLNDNNRPFIGRVGAERIMTQLIAEHSGGDKKFVIDDDFVALFSAKTQWKYDYLRSKAFNEERGTWDKSALISAAAKVPYNKDLKLLCWKVGRSFAWLINNPGSTYGRLLAERRATELRHNEAGDYAEQAAAILASKNIGKSTVAYGEYSKGKLPLAHINARAQRFTVKIFISHLFEEMYRVRYHKKPPVPYVLSENNKSKVGDHNDYIQPEIPFTKVPEDDEDEK